MNTCIYDKTDKGREEIATRKYHIPPRLRTLLVMIDGRNRLDALLANVGALGITEDSVSELLKQEYIHLVSIPEPVAAEPEAAPARISAAERNRMALRARAAAASAGLRIDADGAATVAADEALARGGAAVSVSTAAGAAAPPAALAAAAPPDQAGQHRALYDFYNQTIKSTVGLRGVVLQLKVEKASTIEEFRALRLAYLEAVLKAKGRELALSLRDRLDQLLGGKPDLDDFVLPDA